MHWIIIVLLPAQNSIRRIVYGIAKIFIDPMGLVKTRPAWTMFSKLKASVGLESLSYHFQYNAKDD